MKKYKHEWNNETYTAYYLTSPEDFEKGIKYLNKSPRKLYGLDIETSKKSEFANNEKAGLCPHLSHVRLIQIYDGTRTFVFDVGHTNHWNTRENPKGHVLPASKEGGANGEAKKTVQGRKDVRCPLRGFLEHNKFIAHNAIFEIKHLQKAGIEIDCVCSMIIAQFVEIAEHSPFEPQNEEQEAKYRPTKGFGLAPLIQKYFGVVIPKTQQASEWGNKELTDEQIIYAALDAVLTYELGKLLYPLIKTYKMGKAFKMYKDMQYVIADMELNGMGFDKKAHRDLINEWKGRQLAAEETAKKHFGGCNLRSSKQLNEWVEKNISEKLKKVWPRSEKTGKFSFNKTQLIPIVHRCEALQPFMEYKKYATLLSTFGNSLQDKINPSTNRIHCSFSLGHTRTGRLSSREPNLQNMPARGDTFRHIFVPSKGNVLVVADFSQVEIRVAGELSKDPAIRGAYRNGEDLHKAIVAALENKPISEVTKEERQLGKAINFGLQFGMGPSKLAFYARTSYGVEMSEDAARRAWETYHTKYTVYSEWCKLQRSKAERTGWVRTPMGKVRKLAAGEYYTKAINTPVQGGGAEVSYAALIELRKQIRYFGNDDKVKILNTVHDEIIVECLKNDAPIVSKMLVSAMTHGMKTIFPKAVGLQQLVEANVGMSWAEAK